ncbi:MAG: hypothetical protein ACQEP7_07325 [bacterium]
MNNSNGCDQQVVDEAVPYILLQRTETQSWFKDLRYTLPGGRKIYNAIYNKFLYQVEAFFRGEEVKSEYINHLAEEFERIKPHLPEDPDRILDIGCGIGGMELFLADHYRGNLPDFYLLDKTEVSDQVYYQFKEEAAYYNSLEVARRLLIENEVPPEKIHLLEASEVDLSELPDIDLCMSFLSWAFHYPLDCYLDGVLECLDAEGELILDFRSETGEIEECRDHFEEAEIIEETQKYYRSKFKHPKVKETTRA